MFVIENRIIHSSAKKSSACTSLSTSSPSPSEPIGSAFSESEERASRAAAVSRIWFSISSILGRIDLRYFTSLDTGEKGSSNKCTMFLTKSVLFFFRYLCILHDVLLTRIKARNGSHIVCLASDRGLWGKRGIYCSQSGKHSTYYIGRTQPLLTLSIES